MKILFLHNKCEVTGSRLPFKEKDELLLLTSKKVYCRTGNAWSLVPGDGFCLSAGVL